MYRHFGDTTLDNFRLTHGFWRSALLSLASQNHEARKKFDLGYPRDNILFAARCSSRNDTLAFDADLTQPTALIDALKAFFSHTPPAYSEWERAVSEFQERVPELARRSINPTVADAAVEEMLIQHLLTERLFRTVFNNPYFAQRNIIAAEIEKVIDALASQSFSRAEFLKDPNPR
jgi:hypothetical protein